MYTTLLVDYRSRGKLAFRFPNRGKGTIKGCHGVQRLEERLPARLQRLSTSTENGTH